MKIAVCDDEQHDLDLLCALIQQYNSAFDLTAFHSAGALLDAFQADFYDLVFLDIEMEAPNGFEAAELLMSRPEKPLLFIAPAIKAVCFLIAIAAKKIGVLWCLCSDSIFQMSVCIKGTARMLCTDSGHTVPAGQHFPVSIVKAQAVDDLIQLSLKRIGFSGSILVKPCGVKLLPITKVSTQIPNHACLRENLLGLCIGIEPFCLRQRPCGQLHLLPPLSVM